MPSFATSDLRHDRGPRFAVRNPATLEVIGECSDATDEFATAAVDAAARAFPLWASAAATERGRFLAAFADALHAALPELQTLLVRETGKACTEAAREVAGSVETLRWYAAEAVRNYGRTIPAGSAGERAWTTREPVGVVVAPGTPLSTVRLVEFALDAGLPPGVVNLVMTTRAPEVTRAWMRDPRVRKIAFTGSTRTGRELIPSPRKMCSGYPSNSAAMLRP